MMRLLTYLFNLVFVILIGWIVSRIMQQILGGPRNRHNSSRQDPRRQIRGETARDPVCGMFVSTEVSHRLQRDGATLHFCSQECLDRFQSEARHS